MSLDIAREIVELIRDNSELEIKEILEPYNLEQRRFVMSIKYKCSSLLFIAITNLCVSTVVYFLANCGADPNGFGWIAGEKLSCLAVAIDVNSKTIVEILLRHGANTEVVSSYERTALFHACTDNRQRIVDLLIENGANVNKRNHAGETPLTESTNNLNLFKYLLSKGADINSVDDFGQTVLMLGFEIENDDIIYSLLGCKNIDVRFRNDYGEDALHLAVRYSSEDIIKKIIKKGSYKKNEITTVYELESCLFRLGNDERKAREMWQVALNMQSLPFDTPMFEKRHPASKLEKVVNVLNSGDIPALLYLESILGLNNSLTLGAYARAVSNVNDENKYINISEFFFDILNSLDDRLFFKSFGQCVILIRHYFDATFSDKSNLSKTFEMIVTFIKRIRFRLERMTLQERTPNANKIECFLYFTIELIYKIEERCPEEMHLFHEGIRHILKADLRGLQLKSLIQMCGCLQSPNRIIKCFIRCGADVNSTDNQGKTVLHEMIENEIPSRKKIAKNIVNNGFNFRGVRCDEYCLACRMERENILPCPVKYISLQCLAARTLCEKTMNCFSDIPHYLWAIVNSHSFYI